MKKSMIVMMMMVIAFSMNLFGEVVSEKAKKVEMIEKHVCTAECDHEEMKKECGPDCKKECCTDKKMVKGHKCSDECKMAMKHVCTDECKLDAKTKTCKLADMKAGCMSSMKLSESVKDKGCKPAGCETKAIKKDCHK